MLYFHVCLLFRLSEMQSGDQREREKEDVFSTLVQRFGFCLDDLLPVVSRRRHGAIFGPSYARTVAD
jgi:hypothetical protein